jgi:hypothetical protein
MHGLEETGASQVRQPSSVIAIGLVGRERLERLVGLPAFDADHGEAELAQAMEQDRHHTFGLEYDPTTARRFRQLVRDRFRGRRRLALVDNSALATENADARLVHRDIEASKNNPSNGLLFRIKADPIGVSGREPRPLPDVEKPPNWPVAEKRFDRGGSVL